MILNLLELLTFHYSCLSLLTTNGTLTTKLSAMNTKRYNVVLTAMQSHVKDRKYEDVSKEDVLYILHNNANHDYLRSNNPGWCCFQGCRGRPARKRHQMRWTMVLGIPG